MRWLSIVLIALSALPLQAQSWATRDVCIVTTPIVHPDFLDSSRLEAVEREAREIPNGLGKFWRVTSPNGAVSHLWGTWHSNDPVFLDLPQAVETAIIAARVVAPERNFIFKSRADLDEFARGERRFIDSETEISFRSLDISPQVKDWIRKRMTGLGWDLQALDYLNLAALAEILLYDPCNDFAAHIYPIQDHRIQMLGAIKGAQILSLESPLAVSEKMNDIHNLATTQAIIATYGAYLNPDRTAEQSATYAALYQQGNIGALMVLDRHLIEKAHGREDGRKWLEITDDYLLRERNQNFLAAALPDLHEGGVFLAIGTYHLPRDTGMVALLKDAGFSVERIALPKEALN